MKHNAIDGGQSFDFGRTAESYARYRDIYPKSLYEKLIAFGLVEPDYLILDLGSGPAILPLNLAFTGARFFSTDLSERQIEAGKALVNQRGLRDQIRCMVCSAEETGFESNTFDVVTAVQCFPYFDAEKAAEEIRRILKPGGRFCKIFMDWLPKKDPVIAEMEAHVLRFNPNWSGGGFSAFSYAFPSWAKDRFEIETIHSYDADLTFSKDAWLNRVLTCRGVGASLEAADVARFEATYRAALEKYDDPLTLRHQIHIEIYRSTKTNRE